MDRRIKLAITKIEADPGSWQLSSLAESVNLSKSRLRHLFKQETGTTVNRYLKTARLKRAALLLATTFLSIKEIIADAGYKSGGHFLLDFKSVYGMPPTVFRGRFGLHKGRDREKNGI
jgi:transcriptional regulator GlxA family with amidase domain